MFVSGVLLFSLVLLRLPALFGDEAPPVAVALTVLPFAAAIVVLVLWDQRWRTTHASLLAWLYVALIVVAAFRAGSVETISSRVAAVEALQVVLIATLAAFAFLREPREQARRRYLRSLCWAPVVLIAVNVALHLTGYVPAGQDPTTGLPASTLALFGVTAERVVFAAAGGINGIGPIAAAAFAICATFVIRGERRKLALLGGLVSMYTIVLTDSRGALLFALAAVALVVLIPRARAKGFGWVAVALPVLPVVVAVTLASTAGSTQQFSRTDGPSLSEGTGRTIVWRHVWDFLSEPKADDLFGYGKNGQVVSGVSVGYVYLFRGSGEPNPLSHTTHNLILQTALDLGWVGVLVLISLAALVLAGLGKRIRDPVYAALLAGALAVLLVGVVQASPTPGHLDSFAWWLMVVFAALRVPDTISGTARSEADRPLRSDQPSSDSAPRPPGVAAPPLPPRSLTTRQRCQR